MSRLSGRQAPEDRSPSVWVARLNAAVQYGSVRVVLRRGITTVEDGHPLVLLHPDFFTRPEPTTWPCGRCGAPSTAPLCPEHHPPLRHRRGRPVLVSEEA